MDDALSHKRRATLIAMDKMPDLHHHALCIHTEHSIYLQKYKQSISVKLINSSDSFDYQYFKKLVGM